MTPGRAPADAAARPRPRRGPALWLWLAFVGIAAIVSARTTYVADLSAFLPSSPSPGQAVLLEQVRSGVAARLVLIGIEGGDATVRADASRRLAAAMRESGRFESVHNGDNAEWQSAGAFLFAHRYLLSPAVTPQRFEVDGLRAAIDDTVAMLGTPAGALIKPVLLRDPTGETVRMAEAMLPAQAPRSEAGVWVSRTTPRAVIVATTRAPGADLDAQEAALGAVRTAFAPHEARGMRLVLAGAGVIGVASRSQIKAEVERLAIAGSVLIVALLLVAFGSLRTLAIAALPVATGVLAGIAAVSLGFGHVHGMTLGFGTTLIGEAVDYAIYYLIQAHHTPRDSGGAGAAADRGDAGARAANDGRPASATRDAVDRPDAIHASHTGTFRDAVDRADADDANDAREAAALPGSQHWLRHSWPTVRLGLLTSLCGFAALVFSGFPGLAQLGVFSIAGLVAAALATRWVFPTLAPDGAPGRGLRTRLGRWTGRAVTWLPRARWPLAALALGAAVLLLALPSAWRGDLESLSPVGAAQMAIETSLRADVGAPDAGTLVALAAANEAEALALAEAAGTRLDRLVADGALAGYDSPARLLPSPATQAARRAALPDATTLTARLASATDGGPLAASRLGPFVDDVQAARAQALLDRAALQGTPLAPAVDALLVAGSAGSPWRVFMSLQAGARGALDLDAVRSALVDIPGAQVVAIKAELDGLYARYLHEALLQAIAGAAAVVALLAWHLRSSRRLLRIAEPIAAALLIVLAGLAASGAALGILHLVGLLLVVAIGSNYALFFDHLRTVGATDEDTLASLALANLTTVGSFALLALSGIPALQALGRVVAPGAALCLVLSAAFIGLARRDSGDGRMAPP